MEGQKIPFHVLCSPDPFFEIFFLDYNKHSSPRCELIDRISQFLKLAPFCVHS